MLCACSGNPERDTQLFSNTASYTKEDNLLTTEQHVALGKKLETKWWSLFACESLNKVIQQALTDNYDIAAAKKALAQAEEAVKAKAGSLWPQIAVAANTGNQKYGVALFGPSNFSIPPFTYYEFGPSLSWNIDFFGSTRYSVAYQKALAEYQAHKLDAAYISLTSNVVVQALEIATVKAEIATIQRIVAEDQKTLEMINTRFLIGSGTKIEILNAQTELNNDQALLPPLEQRLDIAKHALAILVGKAPATWQPPSFELENFELPKEIPLSLPSELMHQRPDILAAEASLYAASAAIGIATANMFPSITINANTMQEALTPSGLLKAGAKTWAIITGISAPVFSGGTQLAEKNKAEYSYDAALAQYQQTVLMAFAQVADTLTALQHDNQVVNLQQQTVNTAKSWLELANKSYQAGSIGQLQIQDAERKLARTQLELLQAQRQRYINTTRLFVALGGSPIAAPVDETYD
jgi:NodT family efflux transporter outer membrane factor (OMF) lipoprotein